MNINATIIGQMLTFVVFVWFCMKFIWPPLINVLAERTKKIADGLSAADRAEQDLELAQEKAVAQLKEAKQQAAEIIDQAHKRSSQLIDEAKGQAREEGDRLLKAAQAEIEQEFNRARKSCAPRWRLLPLLAPKRYWVLALMHRRTQRYSIS